MRQEKLMRLQFVSGDERNMSMGGPGQGDASTKTTYLVNGGPHDGHTVTLIEEKHNCGAFGQSVDCSCYISWKSAMNGCCQPEHQREEVGDKELSKVFTLDDKI